MLFFPPLLPTRLGGKLPTRHKDLAALLALMMTLQSLMPTMSCIVLVAPLAVVLILSFVFLFLLLTKPFRGCFLTTAKSLQVLFATGLNHPPLIVGLLEAFFFFEGLLKAYLRRFITGSSFRRRKGFQRHTFGHISISKTISSFIVRPRTIPPDVSFIARSLFEASIWDKNRECEARGPTTSGLDMLKS